MCAEITKRGPNYEAALQALPAEIRVKEAQCETRRPPPSGARRVSVFFAMTFPCPAAIYNDDADGYHKGNANRRASEGLVWKPSFSVIRRICSVMRRRF
jgi:hypothetical protein